jgi:hypothetical protein
MAKLTSAHNLAVVHPKMAKQWHPTLNGDLTPRRVTPSSGKLIWWRCQKGHEWQTAVYRRKSGSGCPNCGKRRVTKQNNLKCMSPHLAAQWHPTKNGALLPQDVNLGSGEKVWWICKQGHAWEVQINNRNSGVGCPVCAREKAWETCRQGGARFR